jgi:hypothetical protein
MTTPSTQTIPVSRIYETRIIRNGCEHYTLIGWCENPSDGPSNWFKQQCEAKQAQGNKPGRYYMHTRLLDPVTSQILESHEEYWVLQSESEPDPDIGAVFSSSKPEKHRWLTLLIGCPGLIAAVIAAPFALVAYLFIGLAVKVGEMSNSD